MATSTQSDLDLLYKLQDPNRQGTVPLSILTPIKISEHQFITGTYYSKKDSKYYVATEWNEDELYYREPIYNIDLDSRIVEAPEYLSVKYDHNAETIYFAVDRYFDNVDLSNVFCIVQYQNANPDISQGGYIYSVPYFDTTSLADENKMLFQWAIEGPATAFSGTITFSIKFYEIDLQTIDSVDGTSFNQKFYKYLLNTQPAKSKIMHGLDVQATSGNYYFTATEVETIYQRIEEISRRNDLYWITLASDGTMYDPNADYPENTINRNDTITDLITE